MRRGAPRPSQHHRPPYNHNHERGGRNGPPLHGQGGPSMYDRNGPPTYGRGRQRGWNRQSQQPTAAPERWSGRQSYRQQIAPPERWAGGQSSRNSGRQPTAAPERWAGGQSRNSNRQDSKNRGFKSSFARSRSGSRSRSRSRSRSFKRRRRSPSGSPDSAEARRIHAQLLGGIVSSDEEGDEKKKKNSEATSSSQGPGNEGDAQKARESSGEEEEGGNQGFNFEEYEKMPVRVSGPNRKLAPVKDWEGGKIPAKVIENLKKNNLSRPTPVQSYAIPIVFGGEDIMASAQTGSGKTLAFLIPIVGRLVKDGSFYRPFFKGKFAKAGPLALILGPTRELVIQIEKECGKLLPNTELNSFAAFGGNNYSEQKGALQDRQTDILASTPGRLLDLFKDGVVTLEFVRFFVFDEADKMMDMGFEKAVKQIVTQLDLPDKTSRQTSMFSATYPAKIRRMADDYLRRFNRLVVGHVGSTVENIDQVVKLLEEHQKEAELLKDLKTIDGMTIVFVQRRQSADKIRDFLIASGETAVSLHGHHEQYEREEAMRMFKKKKVRVLVATGVAARGLDINGITHVVQYDMARDMDEYTHKIGRTGRAGKKGTATTYFHPRGNGGHLASKIASYLRKANKRVPEWLRSMTRRSGGGGRRRDDDGDSRRDHRRKRDSRDRERDRRRDSRDRRRR